MDRFGELPLLVVAAALIDEDGRILVQKRPAGKSMAGLWEFPGGKVEAGEGLTAALSRELAEELAIETCPTHFMPLTFVSHQQDERELILFLYVCRKWTGLAKAVHASEVRWVSADELMMLQMLPADGPFIGSLRPLLSPGKV